MNKDEGNDIDVIEEDKLDVEDVLIKDQKKDTLLYAKSFKLRISDLFFSSNEGRSIV